eukprot:GHVS01056039.1.p1 GENE.GHVS01056039.1~~GHVS01056039.1.p1  ORF type:complete len:159 (+),score=23.60 GHVS01056039.1:629-1105(+)
MVITHTHKHVCVRCVSVVRVCVCMFVSDVRVCICVFVSVSVDVCMFVRVCVPWFSSGKDGGSKLFSRSTAVFPKPLSVAPRTSSSWWHHVRRKERGRGGVCKLCFVCVCNCVRMLHVCVRMLYVCVRMLYVCVRMLYVCVRMFVCVCCMFLCVCCMFV